MVTTIRVKGIWYMYFNGELACSDKDILKLSSKFSAYMYGSNTQVQ